MILPQDYLIAVADAVHEAGGLFVLDCIASGTIWVDMKATGVDVLVSAPQKGWSGSPCCGLVMLSEQACERRSCIVFDDVTVRHDDPVEPRQAVISRSAGHSASAGEVAFATQQ